MIALIIDGNPSFTQAPVSLSVIFHKEPTIEQFLPAGHVPVLLNA